MLPDLLTVLINLVLIGLVIAIIYLIIVLHRLSNLLIIMTRISDIFHLFLEKNLTTITASGVVSESAKRIINKITDRIESLISSKNRPKDDESKE